jgi:hypothetical protein
LKRPRTVKLHIVQARPHQNELLSQQDAEKSLSHIDILSTNIRWMNRNGTCKHHMIFKNDLKKLLVYSGTAMVSELLLEWKQFFDCLLKTQNALNFDNFSSSLLKKK